MKKHLIASLVMTLICLTGLSQSIYKVIQTKDIGMKLLGTSTLHDWQMDARTVEGEAQFEFKAGTEMDLVAVKSLTFALWVKNLKSESKGLDKNANKALKSDEFKDIHYKLTSATVSPEKGGQYLVKAIGNLTIAGVTKETTMNVHCLVNKDATITCSGSAKLNMTEYNVKPPSFMLGAMTTGDAITLNLQWFTRKKKAFNIIGYEKNQLAHLFMHFLLRLKAQQPAMQYFRPYSKAGLNIFEPTKLDTTLFTGIKVRIGGNFTQDFQGLHHQNNAAPVVDANGVNINELIGLTNGFNLAMANLNIDAQLDDGIRMNLTLYLSTRHHEETWVKGGYIQFDKLLFLKSDMIDHIMKSFTIKIGDYEVDYGDQHFRRSDGGNSTYNPFMENYIMDQFATEIGGEVYFHPANGFLAMMGITNGELNPTVVAPNKIDAATGRETKYSPAFHGKLGYDKQLSDDFGCG